MRRTSFLTLLAVTVIAVVVAILVQPSGQAAHIAGAGVPVNPQLAKAINSAARITIASHEQTFTVERVKDGWALKEKGGYAVDPDAVKKLLVSLSEMKAEAPKTAKPDLYGRIEVRDIKNKDSESRLITVTDAKGKTLAKLILGKSHGPRAGTGPGSTYYRMPGAKQAWLARGRVDVDADPVKWLKRKIADIGADRFRSIDVTSDGKTVVVAREGVGKGMKLKTEPLPDGMVPKKDGSVGALASAFADLEFDDVKPITKVDFDKNLVSTAEYRSFDGLVLKVKVAKAGKDEYWVAIEPTIDESAIVKPEGEAAKKVKLKTLDEVKKERAAIEAHVKGWAFKLPSTITRHFRAKLKDLIQKEKTS
jgi:hypothetical protein